MTTDGAVRYSRPIELKTTGDAWEVAGYASTWDRDLGDDVVLPGAFKASLAAGGPVRFLYAHDPSQVIGRPLELREDTTGLFGRFQISQTTLGRDVRTLLRDGALDSFSIGFIPRDFEHDQKAGTRRLKAVDLLEVSVVALPMQPAALVTSVKAGRTSLVAPVLERHIQLLRRAALRHDLALLRAKLVPLVALVAAAGR